MKVRIYSPDKDSTFTIWIPTGLIFTKPGMYIAAKLMSSQARKDYEKKLDELWTTGDPDTLLTPEDEQAAERLQPPITPEQARELLAALRDSKHLMGGLPLVSVENPDGPRVRIDL